MNGEHLIGKVINERYELKESVGIGGMAMVFKAEDRLLQRTVAVKILKESLKDDFEIVEKFASEGKAAAALTHSNIVSVYDAGQLEGLGFIVMEYVDGITLKEYINENKPIKWKTACDIAIQIASALSVAHEHGIIHRDIKPHNILITADGTVKVADFGIASVASSETMVAGGSAMGSVHYISPEQARGGYVDTISDLYSLGVVLYEMVTGMLPFDGDNAVSIALKKLEEEPVSPKVVNLDVPQALDAVIMKAISKEQHARYKTAEEFSDALKNLLNESNMHIVNVRRKEEEQVVEKTPRKREKKENKEKKDINLLVPIIASVVLIASIALGIFFITRFQSKEIQVPNLIGKTLQEAETALSGTNFQIDQQDIVYVEAQEPVGTIIDQNPGANKSVKKKKKITIKLTISSGEALSEGVARVPDLLGKTKEEAIALLEAEGLVYSEKTEAGSEEMLGRVISQEPTYGKELPKGQMVFVTICTTVTDNAPVVVPAIDGKTLEEAKAILQQSGLTVGIVTKQVSEVEEGKVLGQDPVAGNQVMSGSSVNIVISEKTSVATPTPEATPTSTPEVTPTPAVEPTETAVLTAPPATTTPATPIPSTPTPPPVTDEMKKKTLTINIPDSAQDSIVVKVLANGNEIYNQTHQKSEKKVDILVQSKSDAEVEVYMNGELVVRKLIQF